MSDRFTLDLVVRSAQVGLPYQKGRGGAGQVKVTEGDAALLARQIDLLVDKAVIKTGLGGFFTISGEINRRWSGPEDHPQTHGAGFATAVDYTVVQLKILEPGAGGANRHHLGVGAGVATAGDLIATLSDDFTVLDHQSGKGSTAGRQCLFSGQLQAAL